MFFIADKIGVIAGLEYKSSLCVNYKVARDMKKFIAGTIQ